MLYTYSITAQTVAADANLNFNINGVLTGCTVSHSAGTPSIQLKRPDIIWYTLMQVPRRLLLAMLRYN